MVDERGLAGLEIERSGFRLKIDGASSAVPAAAVVAVPVPEAVAISAPTAPAAGSAVLEALPKAAVEAEPEAAGSDLPEDAHVVTSPIVGTFYSSPSPDESAYVKVGDRIEAGQVLCIVEAMKLMNEIESDGAGVVLAIYPKNAQPVEFGEPLFAIGSS